MKFFATGEHWKTDFEKPAKFAPSVGSKVVSERIHHKGDSRPMDQRNYENQFLRDYKEPLRKRHETDQYQKNFSLQNFTSSKDKYLY